MSEPTVKEKAVESKPSLAIDDIQRVFEERQKTLVDFFNKETNVANRYDIKVRIEELGVIFNDVMSLRNKQMLNQMTTILKLQKEKKDDEKDHEDNYM